MGKICSENFFLPHLCMFKIISAMHVGVPTDSPLGTLAADPPPPLPLPDPQKFSHPGWGLEFEQAAPFGSVTGAPPPRAGLGTCLEAPVTGGGGMGFPPPPPPAPQTFAPPPPCRGGVGGGGGSQNTEGQSWGKRGTAHLMHFQQ